MVSEIDLVFRILQGLLTPVIAVIAVYIAYQQHKTNRDKLRFDLYDRRLKVFEGLMVLLSVIFQKGRCNDQERNQFLRSTTEGVFLFDKDIVDYMETIHENALKLSTICAVIDSLPCGDQRRDQSFKNKGQLLNWFTDQFEVSKGKFIKYLRFRQSANISERQTMNWKSGFKRIAWVLSIASFLFWLCLDIYFLLTEGWDLDFWLLLAFGVLSFIAIWVIYYVGLYLVKGFWMVNLETSKNNK